MRTSQTKTRQTQGRRTTTAVLSGRTDQARDRLDVAARLGQQRALPTASLRPGVVVRVLLRLLTLSKPCQARTAILMMMIKGQETSTTQIHKQKSTNNYSSKKEAPDDIGKQLVNVLKESANERIQHEKETLEDQDRLFLMSLIKYFKNIPQHRTLSSKR
ncbi:hypothetical protein J6590_071635 [Homalodisca vitripennis]|nr:hypothetical protein J6590_071635 [Homalodisca vitripennis]